MTVDRNMWADTFTDDLPHWPCPTCGKGHFSVIKDKLVREETGPSKSAHAHDAWEPDWIVNSFTALIQCSMPGCGEVGTVAGSSTLDYDQVDRDEYVTTHYYKVEHVSPGPIPIALSSSTPKPVVDALKDASRLIWASSEAAANQIRQAVESIMDDRGMATHDVAGNRIMLHRRIKEFEATDKDNADVLLATKWIGNSGSHVGGITREDVLDAFDMIEYVIEEVYGNTRAAILAKVTAINAAKGPVKKP